MDTQIRCSGPLAQEAVEIDCASNTVHSIAGTLRLDPAHVTVATENGDVPLKTYIRQLIYDDLFALGERLATKA